MQFFAVSHRKVVTFMNGRTNSTSTGAEFIEIPLDPVTNLNAEAGDGSVRLTWTDPKNKYATDEGETAQDPDQLVSVWKYTKVVRKTGAYSQNPNDGVVVVESGVHNQYQSSPYIDEGLTNDTTYYYSVYAINEDEIESNPVQIIVTPVAGVTLSSLAEGTIVKINENGSPVEFYILQHNYEPELNPENKTLIARTESIGYFQFNTDGGFDSEDFINSSVYNELNTNYIARFTSTVIEQIGTTSWYYKNMNGIETIRSAQSSIFILSGAEHFGPSISVNGDYIRDGKKIKKATLIQKANNRPQWTRSAAGNRFVTSPNVVIVDSQNQSAHQDYDHVENTNQVVPVFTLPNDARFNENNVLIDQ